MKRTDGGELISQIDQVADPLELVVEPLTVVGLVCGHPKWCVLD